MLSFIYRILVSLHRRLTRSRHSGIPVISVGNITVGGTGKTPVVMKIIKDIGFRTPVAVVSRGYGRKTFRMKKVGLRDSYRYTGDEPLLIKKNFPGALVIAAKNRYRGSLFAAENGAGAVILDDGFQSWEIERDLEIVLINALSPFGGGKILPSGRLREPLSALKRADLIVVTKCNYVTARRMEEIKGRIRCYAPSSGIFYAREKVRSFGKIFDKDERPAEFFEGRKAICFSAVGDNRSFHSLLEQYGLDIIEKIEKIDHYRWKENEIKKIVERSKALGLDLITTEKDAVKLLSFEPFECWYTKMETEISEEKKWKEKIYEVIS